MSLITRIAKNAQPPLFGSPGAIVATTGKIKPFDEIGVTGLLRTRGVGYVYDELLPQLSVNLAKRVYREMRDNDPVIGAMFFATEMLLRRAEWHVEEGKGTKAKGEDVAQLVTECLDDMSHPWTDFIAETQNMLAFGFSLFETVYKKRNGPDGRRASKYTDGKIGWRKFAPRAQESILYWNWDEEGGLQGAVQLAAPDYQTVPIPIEKLLLFRTTSIKNNPEGRSLLRNCYVPWFRKRRLEEIEGIGMERDLCGMPVLYASQEAQMAMGGQAKIRQMLRNIRLDNQMGVLLPQAFDEKGQRAIILELLKSGGSKQTQPGNAIGRYNQDILNTMLAGFIQFGQSPTGSRSLHLSASAIFSEAISALMDSVADVMNRIAIPRLLRMNSIDLHLCPKLVAGEIGSRDLNELASFVMDMSKAGLTFFDDATANYVRKIARLPELPEQPVPTNGQPGVPANAMTQPPDPGLMQGATRRAMQSVTPAQREQGADEDESLGNTE